MYIVRLHVQRPQQHIEIFMVTPANPCAIRRIYIYILRTHTCRDIWMGQYHEPTNASLTGRAIQSVL